MMTTEADGTGIKPRQC